MEATYDPKAVEANWYERWEEAGVFRPEHNPDGDPFCIVIPPPNVTGSLHMGHALNHTIHDAIIRQEVAARDLAAFPKGVVPVHASESRSN